MKHKNVKIQYWILYWILSRIRWILQLTYICTIMIQYRHKYYCNMYFLKLNTTLVYDILYLLLYINLNATQSSQTVHEHVTQEIRLLTVDLVTFRPKLPKFLNIITHWKVMCFQIWKRDRIELVNPLLLIRQNFDFMSH